MPLFALNREAISPVQETTFSNAGFRERDDLQRLLRQHAHIVAPETLILAEEFGWWDSSYRRIDLLGLDRDANLVVIELKRDETGAHMELQALRYAAMVARMTFDQASAAYAALLSQQGSTLDARAEILRFLEWDEPGQAAFAKDVRIILVAADFSRELTTSVMWLNERDIDIRCWRLKPYQLGSQLLINVEQVLPLPEASEYQVQVREKARAERAVTSGTADFTRYDLTLGDKTYGPLWKRRMIYDTVRYAIERFGVSPEQIAHLITHARPWAVADGELDADTFRDLIQSSAREGEPQIDLTRFQSDENALIRVNGRTYAFTKMWGTNTRPSMDAIIAAIPHAGISYRPTASEEVVKSQG